MIMRTGFARPQKGTVLPGCQLIVECDRKIVLLKRSHILSPEQENCVVVGFQNPKPMFYTLGSRERGGVHN